MQIRARFGKFEEPTETKIAQVTDRLRGREESSHKNKQSSKSPTPMPSATTTGGGSASFSCSGIGSSTGASDPLRPPDLRRERNQGDEKGKSSNDNGSAGAGPNCWLGRWNPSGPGRRAREESTGQFRLRGEAGRVGRLQPVRCNPSPAPEKFPQAHHREGIEVAIREQLPLDLVTSFHRCPARDRLAIGFTGRNSVGDAVEV